MAEMRLLTVAEAATMLGVSPRTVKRLCTRYDIGIRLGQRGRALLPLHIPLLQSRHEEAEKRRLAALRHSTAY